MCMYKVPLIRMYINFETASVPCSLFNTGLINLGRTTRLTVRTEELKPSGYRDIIVRCG